MNLEQYFNKFRQHVIGIDHSIETPFGDRKMIYADWTASGRLYHPIEDRMIQEIAPFVANTHSESSTTGSMMTNAYNLARTIIKNHVNASETDVIITTNSGMTGVINKFQRILGLKVHENFKDQINFLPEDRPVVFVTHMEHHSNQTSWLETICDVEIIPPGLDGLFMMSHFEEILEKFKKRKFKIAAVTACSNVSGIKTPYHEIASMIHKYGGFCFVDFACSAPYSNINMHPEDESQRLDAIYFSPHKFLGGPSSSGVLIFDQDLYSNRIPDDPGGGTVEWTNPWGEHRYIENIEIREDGGTPAFLQTMKSALCIKLKNEMGVENIKKREEELVDIIWEGLHKVQNLHILASNIKDRQGVVSFYIDDLHYNLAVKLLNDRFGIQVRGGCSCAGTYGHYLLHVSPHQSNKITRTIDHGDLSMKPGWIRLSIHPIMTNEEANIIVESINQVCQNHADWGQDYEYDKHKNQFNFKNNDDHKIKQIIHDWFEKELD